MNLNAFRVFLRVFEKRSMTLAAQDLHLTQSGVSQHIKSLEEEIGFQLFERQNKKIFPTSRATELYVSGRKALNEIETIVKTAKSGEKIPRGRVRIGLPVEFGNNVVLPKLTLLGTKYRDLDFDITLDFATVLSEMVFKGQLDCALIDGFKVPSGLRVEPVAKENLLLVGMRNYVKKMGPVKHTTGYYSKLEYIDYKDGEPIVRSWFRYHLGRRKVDIRVRARIFDVQGVARLITSGLGVGVLPDHVVARLQREGMDLHIFEGKRTPLKNEMCLIYLPLQDRPIAQMIIMDALRGL